MTDFPDLKLKALVSFPAAVTGGAGIDVVKENGGYQFDLDYADFAPPVGGISDPAHQNALLWNDITKQYVLAPVSLIGSGGSVPEAPNDGVQYGRQSLGWTPIAAGSSVLPATAVPLVESGAGAVGVSTKYAREDHVHPAGGGGGTPSDANPIMNGVAAPGTSALYARGDHVHPTDTSRAPLASPAFTGNPTAPTPTPGDNDTSIATTAFVTAAVAAGGTFVDAPSDGSSYGRLNAGWAKVAPLNSPTLTGTPAAPTPSANDNSTKLATTAYVDAAGALKAPLASPVFTGDPKAPTPTAGDNDTSVATTAFVQAAISATAALMRSYLAGLTLSTAGGSTSFSVAAGVAVNSTNIDFMSLAAAITKTTAAWAVGNGAGSFDGTGAAPSANSGWYHVHLIKRPDTGVVDVLTSNSATAPTLPANYTMFRRIGSMRTSGAFQWALFSQNNDEFLWDIPVQDAISGNPGTAAVIRGLTVPTGVRVVALVSLGFQDTNGDSRGYASSPDVSDQAAAGSNLNYGISATSTGLVTGYTWAAIRTNLLAQIRTRNFLSTANTFCIVNTFGWIDSRGKLL